MHKLLIATAAMIMSATCATAQTRLVVDADEVANQATAISTAANDIATKLTRKWRKAHKNLTKAEQDAKLTGAETQVAHRYMTLPDADDTTTVHLTPAAKPVGLVVMTKGDEVLATAYVNEAGGIEYEIPTAADAADKVVADEVKNGNRFTICGIGQPYKLFRLEGETLYTTDITSGETAVYDASTLPDYAVADTHKHHTGAVIGSVVGGVAAVGIIILAAVL